ncbi:hypothetical protein BDV93DRAFT_525418 [Ceratobasidium sp. AG-I]|nr:hypothetical protein BDV93DRAFT_525418 [Ceratobasidium sp. AG-I]
MASFDSALDALFKSSAGASVVPPRPAVPIPIPSPVAKPSHSSSKRKHEKNVAFVDQSSSKRQRSDVVESKIKDKKGKKKPPVDSSDEDEDPVVEDSYQQRKPKKVVSSPAKSIEPFVSKDAGSGSNSDSGTDDQPPVHESLLPTSEKPTRKKKFVPLDETPEQRDARTIFIGNLPASAANNVARKALHKHILSCLQTAHPDLPKPKIESSRFRSVAFKTPTSKLPSDALSTPSKSTSTATPKPTTTTTSTDHNRSRAADWRAAQDPDGSHKIFQTPAQKKKTAFITGALHDSAASSATAYVVFAHPVPVEGSEPGWDPVEVAARAVKACNGTMFKERVLRVDRVRAKGTSGGVGVEEEMDEKADPRTMVFVGNLDFEIHDDALRDLFEKLVEKERGTAAGQGEKEGEKSDEEESDEEDEDEDEDKAEDEAESQVEEDGDDSEAGDAEPVESTTPKTPSARVLPSKRWVKSVRIIRDKDTQLGKGFGYVQFYDRTSADEILAMEPGTIKLAKRKLRIQRCKTLPGVTLPKPKQRPSRDDNPNPTAKNTTQNDRHSDKTNRPTQKPGSAPRRNSIPRADPTLGERIRTLSKDERKDVKSSDADRVARRLAKKKARIVMERGERKAGGGKESILGGKPGGAKGKGGKVSKGGKRERSDKAIMKKNVKK